MYMPVVVLFQTKDDGKAFNQHVPPFKMITDQKHVHSYHFNNLEADTLYLVKVVQYNKPKTCLNYVPLNIVGRISWEDKIRASIEDDTGKASNYNGLLSEY